MCSYFKKSSIRAPSVWAQISCSAAHNTSWQSRDLLKRQQHQNALFCLWLGRGHWDEFYHLASIQKGLLSFMMQLVKYQQSWTVLLGLWRTALLFACKWAASNSMTTETINNGGIGWNPCCKHVQLEHKCRNATLGWKQSLVCCDASSFRIVENGDFLHQVSVLKAESVQVVCLPPIDSELCRRSLLDLSPASEDQ